jgi:hypothetical protein
VIANPVERRPPVEVAVNVRLEVDQVGKLLPVIRDGSADGGFLNTGKHL